MKKITHRFMGVVLILLAGITKAQISGVVTVPGTYASIAAVINTLNTSGVNGALTVNIAAGYTETAITGGYTLNAIPGASSTNSVVFQKSGSGANPIIYAYSGGTGTPASAVQDGVWRFVGTDYVTVDGINITDLNSSNPATMEFGYCFFKASATDGCQNNTIKNCVITLNRINNAAGAGPAVEGSRGIGVVNASPATHTTAVTTTSVSGANSNNRFYTNTIQNCNVGISLIGFADVSPFTNADTGNDVGGSSSSTGNTIINFGGGGTTSQAEAVTTLNQYSLNVSYNTINNNNGSGVNHAQSLYGIIVGAATSANTSINNNTITLSSGGTTQALTGITNSAGSTAASNAVNINNNLITGCTYTGATSAAFNGIMNYASSATVNINGNNFTNNSIAGGSSTGGFINNSGSATTVININNNNSGANSCLFTGATSGSFNYIYNASGASTATLNITGNNIQGITYSVAASGAPVFIYNGAATITQNINNNTFTNLSLNTSGSVTFISNNVTVPSGSTQNINGNSIVTGFSKTQAGGTITLYSTNASSSTGVISNNSNNNFSNITLTGATTMAGWSNTDGGTPTKNITGNVFSNWTCGSSGVTCFNVNFNGNNTSISSNTISNITGSGAITGISYGASGTSSLSTIAQNSITNLSSTSTGGAVTAITTAASPTTFNINNNIVGTLASVGSASVRAIVVGSGGINNVFKNKIYDISVTNSGGAANGLSASSGTCNMYNNIIGDLRGTLSSGANMVIGINITGGSLMNVYFNSVYLNASSSAATFGSSALFANTTPTLNLINNILVNRSTSSGTGITSAFKRSSTTLTTYASTSNNNIYYAGTPGANNAVFYDGTNMYLTVADFKALLTNRDLNSVMENASYVSTVGTNATFLTLSTSVGTAAESGGTTISGITDDYAGTTRNVTTPDIGAFEGSYLPYSACAAAPAAGTAIATATLLCPGSTNYISLPANYTLSGLSYQWQQSTSSAAGPYTTIPSATNTAYTSTAAISNTWYQAVITCSASGTSSSTPVQVNAGLAITPTAVAGSATVCPGQSSAITLTNASVSGVLYQWQSSTAGSSGPYSAISGQTLSSTTPTNITATTWYQAVISCSASASASVASAPAQVNTGFPSTVIPVTATGATLVCSTQNAALSLTGVTGSGLGYQWQSATTSSTGVYSAISGATVSTATASNVTVSTWYEAVVSCTSNPTYSMVSIPVLVNAIASVSYAPVPFLENFDGTWENRCDVRNVPKAAYWTSNPTTGNNSWRRQDDGAVAGWSYLPTGPNSPLSGAGCANFHSYGASASTTGALNLYLNMTAASPNYSLSFYYINPTGIDSMQILLSTNGGSTFTRIGGYITQSSWTKKVINLGAINSSSCIITFSANSDFGNDDISIDSLEVKTCPSVNPVSSATAALCSAAPAQTLSASGTAYAYYWNGSVVNNSNTAVSPSVSTTYTVIGSNGLCAVTKTIGITINPTPTVAITGPSGLCTGQTLTLTASGANTYSWSTAASTASITDSPSVTTVYTVVGTATNGCQSATTQSVTVAAGLNIQITGPSTICVGQTASLVASGGVTYTWSTTQNATTITPTPTINTTYTLIGASGTCSNTASKTVSVNPVPSVAVSGNSVICAGQSTTLTATGANTYSWSSGAATASAVVSPTTNVTYTVTGTTSLGCAGTMTAAITSNSVPVISVAASPTAVCVNATSSLTATGANTYTWTGGPTSSLSVVTPTANTVYTVTGTNAALCSASKAFTLTTFSLPVITISPASPTICSTATLNLTAAGASTYAWSGGPATNTYVVNPANATTYSITGTSTAGCVSTATVGVTTNTLPVLSIVSSASTVCSQSPVSYTASGANTYLWSSLANTSTVTMFPVSNTTYTVTGTNTQNCSSTATVAVSTLSLPTIAVTPPLTTVCVNSPASFTASGAVTYTWANSSITGSTAVLTPTGLTSYNVSGTGANGCTSNGSFLVFTNPLPVISIAASSPTACSLSATTFTASGANTYSWSSSQSGAVVTVHPANATTYTVTGTNTVTGCAGTQTVTVATLSLPVVNIAPASPTVCAHTPLTLNGSGAITYLWSNGSINTGINLTPTTTTTYTLTGTDAIGCSNIQTVTITVNALPTIVAASQTVCVDDVATFTPSGAATYTMMPGNLTTYTATQGIAGIYSYTISGTDNHSCMNKVTITLDVENCTGIKTQSFSGNVVSVYPNPSNGVFTAQFNFAGEKRVMIVNSVGELMLERSSSTTSETFDISHLTKGVYFVRVSSKEASGNYKIIIN